MIRFDIARCGSILLATAIATATATATTALAQGPSFHFPWPNDTSSRRFTPSSPRHTGEAAHAWDINRGWGDDDCGDMVVAAETGTVSARSCDDEYSRLGYGCYIKLDHSGGHRSVYAHLQAGSRRGRMGQHVCRGVSVGRVGRTGLSGDSAKCHLHFHATRDGSAHKPVPVWGKTAAGGMCTSLRDVTVDDRTPYWSCTLYCGQ